MTTAAVAPKPEIPAEEPTPELDPTHVIDVLVAVIHAPKDDARIIATRLRAGGIAIADEQVEAVFERYELGGKKTVRSRSRRSRR